MVANDTPRSLPDRGLTISEAAQILAVSPTSVRNWAEAGELRATKHRVRDRFRWTIDPLSVEAMRQLQLRDRPAEVHAGAEAPKPLLPPSEPSQVDRLRQELGDLRFVLAGSQEIVERRATIDKLRRQIDALKRQEEELREQIDKERDEIERITRATITTLSSPGSAVDLDV